MDDVIKRAQYFFQSVHLGVSGKGSNFAIFSRNGRLVLQLLYYRTTVIIRSLYVRNAQCCGYGNQCKFMYIANGRTDINAISLIWSALERANRWSSETRNQLRSMTLRSSNVEFLAKSSGEFQWGDDRCIRVTLGWKMIHLFAPLNQQQ